MPCGKKKSSKKIKNAVTSRTSKVAVNPGKSSKKVIKRK